MLTHRRRLAALLRLPGSSGQRDLAPVSGNPNSPEVADPTVSYLADLLAETREELTRADSKAALLLAASGVVIGALLAGLFGSKWTPFDLNNKIEWLWWLGVASAAFGVFSIAAAVYPRVRRHGTVHPGVPSYYGDVAAYENIDAFRRAIEKVPRSRERLIDQIFVLSSMVQHKYLLLRQGLRCLLLAILACTIAVLTNIPLGRLSLICCRLMSSAQKLPAGLGIHEIVVGTSASAALCTFREFNGPLLAISPART
jgi:MFS family permease